MKKTAKNTNQNKKSSHAGSAKRIKSISLNHGKRTPSKKTTLGSRIAPQANYFSSLHQTDTPTLYTKPELLAPAGDMQCALAAFAAGADAVYLGLKHFSARMQAENFSTSELARLTDFAHANKRKIFVAMNTVLKPQDSSSALRLIRRLTVDVAPDALILQDLGTMELARQAGFNGEFHLSTLANVTHQKALLAAKDLGASRVILPRELSLAELHLMNAACPQDMSLELFVHGALCFCVSGRCWWSSYMGGKSGLRGRCVQPCRRVYKQKNREGRFFSSLDLSLDNVVKDLLPLNNLRSWKIEGRRKSPHYVYHVTSAYNLLREEGQNPAARKEAAALLTFALGRETTKALFSSDKGTAQLGKEASPATSKKDLLPITSKDGQTSSGLLCGKIGKTAGYKMEFRTRFPLLEKDYLRIGYEDEAWHNLVSVHKPVPQESIFEFRIAKGTTPPPGTPVFLIDRKEPTLAKLLSEWQKRLEAHNPALKSREEDIMNLVPQPYSSKRVQAKTEIIVRSSLPHGREGREDIRPGAMQGLWLSAKALSDVSKTLYKRISWWLPPVIWPNEDLVWARVVRDAIRGGANNFVLNSPWQRSFFTEGQNLQLTAGPFCNITNAQAIATLKNLGFTAAIISTELGQEDILSLPGQSLLPLGIVISGYWPMGISRHNAEPLKTQELLHGQKSEEFWLRRYGQNMWIYPAWPMDLSAFMPKLVKAGYSTFVTLKEHPPKEAIVPKRTSIFNWENNIL